MAMTIERLLPGDWAAVAEIFRQGIESRNATFETAPPSWEDWDRDHLPAPRLVARNGGRVVGWAAVAPTSTRRVYRGVVELSLYVAEAARGKGVGRALLERLIAESEALGIWTLQAGIFPENAASLALHRACGFREVGVRERLGREEGGWWRDIALLERRSRVVGVE